MHRHPAPFLARCWLPLLAALLLAACSTVQVSHAPTTPQVASNPVIAQAQALAARDASLQGQARSDNHQQIDKLLAGLDDASLAREAAALAEGDPLYNFAGRALLNRGLPLPRPFDRGGNWHFDAGNRPPADSDGYRPPLRLAVLLPLTGNLSAAAAPVRDGLLAGYYGETRRRPDINFYDTTGTADGALAAYAKAVAEGADYVLGPLGRDQVSAMFHSQLSVPVLALNRGNIAPPGGNASFSLAPEDDGIAAAEYLLARGARKVLVLADGDDSMRRAVAAFREQLLQRGGSVIDTLVVADIPADMAPALQAAAQKPGGIDAVFLALKPTQARTLSPQLALAGLGGKLRVATSQLASGASAEDHALDGIAFPSEAWATGGIAGLPSASSAAATLPTARGPAAKLFAFGYDAWLVTAYLERLATSANGVHGATGTLRIDGFGNVLRTPAWSTFNGATVVPLANAGG